jgi:hypothetical protein
MLETLRGAGSVFSTLKLCAPQERPDVISATQITAQPSFHEMLELFSSCRRNRICHSSFGSVRRAAAQKP